MPLENSEDSTLYQIAIIKPDEIQIYQCHNIKCKISSIIPHNFEKINQVIYSQKLNSFFIAQQTQITKVTQILQPFEKCQFEQFLEVQNINQLSFNSNLDILAFSNQQKIYFCNVKTKNIRFEYLKSFTKIITSLAWNETDNSLWVGGSQSQVQIFEFFQINNSFMYYMHALGFINGLPVANIKNIQIYNNFVVLCNEKAVLVFQGSIDQIIPTQKNDYSNYQQYQGVGQIGSPQTPWLYFSEQRWIPSGNIITININQNQIIQISTEYGMAQITNKQINLNQKSEHYEEIVSNRFHYLGYVSENSLKNPGDVESGKLNLVDNMGLWNNMYLGAECYRYKNSQSEEAKKQVWNIFRAQERLYDVIPPEYYGLMAKAVDYREEKLPDEKWHYSTQPGFEQFMYKDNASSDDVTSYFFAFPLMIEYVCETQEEKDLVFSYMQRTMDYIMENGYVMINIGGKRTQWGLWDPQQLNGDPEYYSERTLNSLEILSYLAATYKYSGKNEKYLNTFIELGEKYEYFQNIIDWRYQDPRDVNFSDDELGNLAFHTFFFVQDVIPTKYVEIFQKSLLRSWSIYQSYQPSWYTFQTCIFLKDNKELLEQVMSQQNYQHAVQELQDWPLEMVNWNVNNIDRLDLVELRNNLTRIQENTPDMTFVVRRSERVSSFKWNTIPFKYNTDNANGSKEEPPTAWLLSYYMGQYYENYINNK